MELPKIFGALFKIRNKRTETQSQQPASQPTSAESTAAAQPVTSAAEPKTLILGDSQATIEARIKAEKAKEGLNFTHTK